jgi:hypothetical protein
MDCDVDADESMGFVMVTTRELLENNGRTFLVMEVGDTKKSGVLVVGNTAVLELLWNPQVEVEYGAMQALAEAVEDRNFNVLAYKICNCTSAGIVSFFKGH